MAWILLLVNVYFDYLVAAMFGVVLAFVVAKMIIDFYFAEKKEILGRILSYGMIVGAILLFCTTYIASITDPEFSAFQRYRNAIHNIQNWFFPADPLLARGGMEQAIRLDTGWVSSPEKVFYSVENKLYFVALNGSNHQELYTADSKITKAVFSPNGRKLLIKTQMALLSYDLITRKAHVIYEIVDQNLAPGAKIQIGGMQWSPDSQKICFFVQKSSPVSAQSRWFVYDHKMSTILKVPLNALQPFLLWGKDSITLYFNQVIAQPIADQQQYRIKWFKVSLTTSTVELVNESTSEKAYVSADDFIRKEGDVFFPDPLLNLESPQPFFRAGRIISSSGKRLWVNDNLQLCYESAYGVRYILFGLSPLHQYLNFPPKDQEQDLVIQEIRWMPSEQYVLLRHYTHGLLVLDPTKRQLGVLINEQVGIFGFYPY